jgi:methionyl-tRNA formyltransferase
MKLVFFGTPDYVIPILQKIHNKFAKPAGVSPFVAVVTQPPAPVGRKQILTYSPVDKWAYKRKIAVFHSVRDLIKAGLKPDLGILAAYGEIIPKPAIDLFAQGILNVHPSLLPKYRGASPVQAVIASGDQKTGVTIIKIDEELDHGPIISQFDQIIDESDTTGSLRASLFDRAAEVLAELIKPYLERKIKSRPQDHAQATFTVQLKKQHGFIPPQYLTKALAGKASGLTWSLPFVKDFSTKANADSLNNFIRAMTPWPGAWSNIMVNGQGSMVKRLKILKAHLGQPSTTRHQLLILDEVQLEGKEIVSWEDFQRGYPDAVFE